MFKRPEKGRLYVCTVDVARGTNKDYSAFIIFDVTKDESRKVPYEVVATYKNNEVKPFVFPNIFRRTWPAKSQCLKIVGIMFYFSFFTLLEYVFPSRFDAKSRVLREVDSCSAM